MDNVEVRYKLLQKYYGDVPKNSPGTWMICGISNLPKIFLIGTFNDVLYSVSQMESLWEKPNIQKFSIKEIKIHQAGNDFKQSIENKITELRQLIISKKKEVEDLSPEIYRKERELNGMKSVVNSIKSDMEKIQEEIDGYTRLF